MSIAEYQKMFRKTLKPEVEYAGRMLEDRGLRFGADYGTSNAVQKATEIVIESLEEMDVWDRFGYGI
jgi:predicted site-specific integrase-resolvase